MKKGGGGVRQTDLTKQLSAFRKFLNALKKRSGIPVARICRCHLSAKLVTS